MIGIRRGMTIGDVILPSRTGFNHRCIWSCIVTLLLICQPFEYKALGLNFHHTDETTSNKDDRFHNNPEPINLDLFVFLEGPYDADRDMMRSILYEKGYLPGQEPLTFFGSQEPAGQPYFRKPWSYDGIEGKDTRKGRDLYPQGAVDWVLVSLRSEHDSSSEVYRSPAILIDDGSIFFNESWLPHGLDPKQPYFVVIEHRNHLLVMSSDPISLKNGSLTFDFRKEQSFKSLFGHGQKEVAPGIYAMFAGNVGQTGMSNTVNDINYDDINGWAEMNGKNSAYLLEDIDLDGDVNVKDSQFIFSNLGIFSDVDQQH